MKKLNNTILNKLILQAEEAKEFGLNKLGSAVLLSVESNLEKDNKDSTISSQQLKEQIYNDLWKSAMNVISYHDVESADIQKLDNTLSYLSQKFLLEVEAALDVSDQVGKLEPKLPGEKE